ncbi:MAG: hypothetical protein COA78_38770, partial [Blastopirellula sp.]
KILVEIWAELLGLAKESISITSNFFELGGHSLLVVHLLGAIKKRVGIELPLRVVYESMTIQHIANVLDKDEKENEVYSIHSFVKNSKERENIEEYEF